MLLGPCPCPLFFFGGGLRVLGLCVLYMIYLVSMISLVYMISLFMIYYIYIYIHVYMC